MNHRNLHIQWVERIIFKPIAQRTKNILLKLRRSTQGRVIRTGFLWRLGFLLQGRACASWASLSWCSRPWLLCGRRTRTALWGWLWGVLGWLWATLGRLPGWLALSWLLRPLLGLTDWFGTLATSLRAALLGSALSLWLRRATLSGTLCCRRPLRSCWPLTGLSLGRLIGPGLLSRGVLSIRAGHRLGLGRRLALRRGPLLWRCSLTGSSSASRGLLRAS